MMAEKLKISQAVIVEGKYDKIKLSDIIDAFIIETNGFSIFKDSEKKKFIKKLALQRGIIILTDSDHAGFMIRSHISSFVEQKYITNVYIPDIFGKEKRKTVASKEGKLGVEGMSKDVLLSAFEKANVSVQNVECVNPVTNFDFFDLGLAGGTNSKAKRCALCKKLDLPEFLSTKSLISCINNTMNRDEFIDLVKKL